MMTALLPSTAALLALVAGSAVAAPSTLASVRANGALRCGVVSSPEDWTKTDLHGQLAPLSIEMCKAVSVTALGAQAHATIVSYRTELEAETALARNKVDVVMGVTPEATSMWHFAIAFGAPYFYDAQGLLLRRESQAKTLADLGTTTICMIDGTDTQRVIQARAEGTSVRLDPFQEEGEMDDAVSAGRCGGMTAMLSHLYQLKAGYPGFAKATILPETYSLSPVAPAVRQGDAQWQMIVDWTIYALIQAEASNVTAANIAVQGNGGSDPVIQRLVGYDWATSRALGLQAHDWAAQVIAVVGNYGEIYDRTLGEKSAVKMPRGLNRLWLQGGLIHPLPVQ